MRINGRRCKWVIVMLLLTISCSSQNELIATHKFSQDVTGPITQEIPDLSQARTIQIRDYWSGLSEVAPTIANFYLERKHDSFVGIANFEAGGYSLVGPLTATTDIAVPLAEAQAFLALLIESPLQKNLQRRYLPFVTDSYPERLISVMVEDWSVAFYYAPYNLPHPEWYFSSTHPSGLCQTPCLTTSDAPKHALEILDPYLKREIHERLYEEIRTRQKEFLESCCYK